MRLGALKVDFMPDDEAILGFSNRWYAMGVDTATPHQLSEDLTIQVLTPAVFLATKLEAFAGRGNDDLFTSRDAEDILLVVDGREGLIDEITSAENDVRAFIANGFRALLDHTDFDDFLEGNIRGPAGRVDIVRDRFAAIHLRHCADDIADED